MFVAVLLVVNEIWNDPYVYLSAGEWVEFSINNDTLSFVPKSMNW